MRNSYRRDCVNVKVCCTYRQHCHFCTLSCNIHTKIWGVCLYACLLYFCFPLSDFTKLFCIPNIGGTGRFYTKWLYCKLNGKVMPAESGSGYSSTGLCSQAETVVTRCLFCEKHQPPRPVETTVNFLTRPCDCIFYIGLVSVLSIEPFQFLLKVWVCLLLHAGKEKKKRYILSV